MFCSLQASCQQDRITLQEKLRQLESQYKVLNYYNHSSIPTATLPPAYQPSVSPSFYSLHQQHQQLQLALQRQQLQLQSFEHPQKYQTLPRAVLAHRQQPKHHDEQYYPQQKYFEAPIVIKSKPYSSASGGGASATNSLVSLFNHHHQQQQQHPHQRDHQQSTVVTDTATAAATTAYVNELKQLQRRQVDREVIKPIANTTVTHEHFIPRHDNNNICNGSDLINDNNNKHYFITNYNTTNIIKTNGNNNTKDNKSNRNKSPSKFKSHGRVDVIRGRGLLARSIGRGVRHAKHVTSLAHKHNDALYLFRDTNKHQARRQHFLQHHHELQQQQPYYDYTREGFGGVGGIIGYSGVDGIKQAFIDTHPIKGKMPKDEMMIERSQLVNHESTNVPNDLDNSTTVTTNVGGQPSSGTSSGFNLHRSHHFTQVSSIS